MSSLKIIFFTHRCSHGLELLKSFKKNNIPIFAIFVEMENEKNPLKKCLKNIAPDFCINLLRKIRGAPLLTEWENIKTYYQYTQQVNTVKNFNDLGFQKDLEAIQPDLIILGGTRIIKSHILETARLGTLNAHPGILPKYRGVDVIPWAIYNGDEIGVSVHYVDPGVDTGKICITQIIPIKAGNTLQSLAKQAEVVAGELMAKVVKKIMTDGYIQTLSNPIEAGKQYYKMDKDTLKKTEEILKQL